MLQVLAFNQSLLIVCMFLLELNKPALFLFSVMLNWEMEFKKWCPAFKLLTYYGSAKERQRKRQGWSKPNAFHVCITSYTLVLQVGTQRQGVQLHVFEGGWEEGGAQASGLVQTQCA